jgi:hypothetical protein
MSELPTGGGRTSARNIILMLIICSSKRKDSHEEALKAYVSAHPKAHYVVAAAGDACGEIYFAKTVPHHPLAARNRINMNMPLYATGS